MNLTNTVPKARIGRKRSARLRDAMSLLGGALLGSSIMVPILAGGDAVDGDAFVIFFSGVLALLGIGVHVAGSGGSARASANMASMPRALHSTRHSGVQSATEAPTRAWSCKIRTPVR
jgi:hypothetical protein